MKIFVAQQEIIAAQMVVADLDKIVVANSMDFQHAAHKAVNVVVLAIMQTQVENVAKMAAHVRLTRFVAVLLSVRQIIAPVVMTAHLQILALPVVVMGIHALQVGDVVVPQIVILMVVNAALTERTQ